MPNNRSLDRQRMLGGVIGVAVLAGALAFHFFPSWFHASPIGQAHVPAAATATLAPDRAPEAAEEPARTELNAGPPLALAPTAVLAARLARKAPALPRQLTPDPPKLRALLDRADRALAEGHLTDAKEGAAALFLAAATAKPDSRRAAQGVINVRARLTAQTERDITLGNAEDAEIQLTALERLPDTADTVTRLHAALKTLADVRPLLARAAGLLQQGKAEQPAGHSALDVYRQVQQLDPRNAVAEQGLLDVQRVVLDRALAAVAQNDFAGADKVVATARTIYPGSQPLREVIARIAGMRRSRAEGLLMQARSALDADNIALATKLAAQVRVISPDLAGLDDFTRRIADAEVYGGRKPGQAFTDRYVDLPGQSPTMVVVPTGSFLMGASGDGDRRAAELPRHPVTFSRGFAIARGAVTVAQFREFVRVSGYVPDSVRLGGASVYDERAGLMRDDARRPA